jgi:type I restriction enzyme S subunit
MSEWASAVLGDVSSIITGPFGTQLHSYEYVEQGIPVIMPQNISGRTFSLKKIACIDDETAKRLKRYVTTENDIVYSRRGDIEKHAFITKEQKGSLCGTGCFRVRITDSAIYPAFLSFFLNRPETKLWLMQHAVGSNMPNLNTEILANIPIAYPDLPQQQSIATILDNIDRKISLNNAINAELEKAAKLLYDYWFVQFDFPNAEGKPYRSGGGKMVYNEQLKRKIPKGWKVENFANIASITTGKEDANFSTPNGNYKFFTCSKEPLRCDIPAFNGQAVLIAGNGDFNVKHYSGEFNAYQRTYVIQPNNPLYYSAMYIASNDVVDILKKGSYGSIVKFITLGDVQNIKLLVSDNPVIYIQLNKIYQEIELLEKENEHLTALRNFLLPLLMNGQVTVAASEN